MPCLAPYKITSLSFPEQNGPVFVDHEKTKRIAVFTAPGQSVILPCPDAILLHEKTGSSLCSIRWYECPSIKERSYSIVVSGCEVFVTTFENGFSTFADCDGREYGTLNFCFGKIYSGATDDGVSNTQNKCQTIFMVDDNIFSVQGNPGIDSGLFDCSPCEHSEQISAFQDVPVPLQVATNASDVVSSNDTTTNIVYTEGRTSWVNKPDTDASLNGEGNGPVGFGISGNVENQIMPKGTCESQGHPSITTTPDGHCVIAYEDRNATGQQQISLAIFETSVLNKIVYYRAGSRGSLLNSDDLVYNTAIFEIFEELTVTIDEDGVPTPSLYIGFLTGPLKGGSPFAISTIVRDNSNENRVKYTVKFGIGERNAVFEDSNNANDVSWFLMKGSAESPTDISLLDISPHKYKGEIVPLANPSISVSHNNIMTGMDQNIYLSYQAFENKQWNIYLRQIRLSEHDAENPKYEAPYSFREPSFVSVNFEFDNAIYKLVDINATPSTLCGLFEVFTVDGRPVFNCNSTTGTFTTDCNFTAQNDKAYVEAVFSLATCGTSSIPAWTVGNEYTGSVMPVASQIGWSGESSCISISSYPDKTQWCYRSSSCTQYYVLDDPYCPSPYLDQFPITYRAEDLWVIKSNEDYVTRVLYHMSTVSPSNTAVETTAVNQIDFMFVIESGSHIFTVLPLIKQRVEQLSSSMQSQGLNVRFGLTIFGAYGANVPDEHAYLCDWRDVPLPPWTKIYNGLWDSTSAIGGFTNDINDVKNALITNNFLGNNPMNGYSAIAFALNDPMFQWRTGAKKYIMFIADGRNEHFHYGGDCGQYSNDASSAIEAILSNNAAVILALNPNITNHSYITSLQAISNPQFDVFNYAGPYDVIFAEIPKTVIKHVDRLRILERDNYGYQATFIRNAELMITYKGDLSDYWTYEKSKFQFDDIPPLIDGVANKGLSKFPYDLHASQIYGVDSVHYRGDPANWVYFNEPGNIIVAHPYVGFSNSVVSDPMLIYANAVHPITRINNKNEVFIVCSSFISGYYQIIVLGTGDLYQNSITGSKAFRTTKLTKSSDFAFQHQIDMPVNSVNQLADFVIDNNNTLHVAWQSNKDGYWEIYYANSSDMFEPVRVTNSLSKSALPKINVDTHGEVYIVFHDNRFGNYEIMLATKREKRIIPLLEQDAYLASMRADYDHYTNILPTLIANPIELKPIPGQLFGSKIASEPGNENENYIFRINDDGSVGGGGSLEYEIIAMAGKSDGKLYGITKDHKLLLIDQLDDGDINIEVNEISEIGTINIPVPPIITKVFSDEFSVNGAILDEMKWTRLSTHKARQCSGVMMPCDACTDLSSANCSSSRTVSYLAKTSADIDRPVAVSVDLKSPNAITPPDLAEFQFVLRADKNQLNNGSVPPAMSYSLSLQYIPLTPPIIISDDFNRTNAPGSNPLGSLWLIIRNNSPDNPIYISDQKATFAHGAAVVPSHYEDVILTTDTVGPDQSVSCNGYLQGAIAVSGAYFSYSLILRSSNTGGDRYVITFLVQVESSVLQKYVKFTKYISGFETQQATVSSTADFLNQPTFKATCITANGQSIISAYVNGALIHAFTDSLSPILTNTRGGFGLELSDSQRPYTNAFYIDNFECRDIDAIPPSIDIVLTRHEQATDRIIAEASIVQPLSVSSTFTNYKINCITQSNSVLFAIFRNNILLSNMTDSNTDGSGPILTNASESFSYGFYQISHTDNRFLLCDNFAITLIPTSPARSQIIDAAHDNVDRLWSLVADVNGIGESSLRVVNINKLTAAVDRESVVMTDIDKLAGGLTIAQNGDFYVCGYKNDDIILTKSLYPSISSIVSFNFAQILSLGIPVTTMTIDENDKIYLLDENNTIYTLDVLSDTATALFNLTSADNDPYVDDPYTATPIAKISGFAYHYSGQYEVIGETGFFHALLEFFDNINLEGKPHLVIDSRDNLEAFLVEASVESDPYIGEAKFSGPSGVYLTPGNSGFIFFDASHFRPNVKNLSYPYGFDTNQTYFVKASLVSPSGKIIPVDRQQKVSFSCNKCTLLGGNIFDSESCSYSFSYTNSTTTDGVFNLIVDFYADVEQQNKIRRYYIQPGHTDLEVIEINNKPASEAKSSVMGFDIQSGESMFIQVYPHLDISGGFICGVDYYPKIFPCETADCDNNSSEESVSNIFIYWVSNTPDNVGVFQIDGNNVLGTSKIHKSRIDGSEHQVIFTKRYIVNASSFNSCVNTTELGGIVDIAIYQAKIYYQMGPKIFSILMDGSGDIEISCIPTSSTRSRSIAIDIQNGKMYNTIGRVQPGVGGLASTIEKSNIDGSLRENVLQNTLYYFGIHSAIDHNSNLHYSIQYHFYHQIAHLAVKSTVYPYPYSSQNNFVGITAFDIDPSNNKIYFSIDNIIKKADLDTLSSEIVLTVLPDNVSDMVVDNTIEKIIITSGNRIYLLNFDGSNAEIIVSNPGLVNNSFSIVTNVEGVTNSVVITGTIVPLRQTFRCNCSSNIFDNKIMALSEISRWESSGQGYADTRITDSTSDNMKPIIVNRSTGAAIILFESHSDGVSRVKAATFRPNVVNEMFSSGTKSWFDYDLNINGHGTAMTNDLYDRIVTAYAKPDDVAGMGSSSSELPGSSVYLKICDFDEAASSIADIDKCDISKLENNIVATDRFVSAKLINKVLISPVDYYTYNAIGELTAVVSVCNVLLKIWATPETVAIRLKNENSNEFGSWCAFAPEISDYMISKTWELSKNSGIKEICIQAMMYSGISAKFCVPVIADYSRILYEVKLYKSGEDEADDYKHLLPTFNSMFVAATQFEPLTGDARLETTIQIEITPSSSIEQDNVNYDIIQQGTNDLLNLSATSIMPNGQRITDQNGRIVYRGQFVIKKDDNLFHKDGLAKIAVRLPGSCESNQYISSASMFSPDKYNVTGDSNSIKQEVVDDLLSGYRQSISGRIGVDIVIRPTNEDPYLFFGSANEFINKYEPVQQSIPLSTLNQFDTQNNNQSSSESSGA